MYKEIIEIVDIRKALEFYGVKFKNKKALCLLHKEKTPSLIVYEDTQTFQCMGCKAGGNIIIFVSKLFGLNNKDAAIKINEDLKLNIPITSKISKQDLIYLKTKKIEKTEKEIQEEENNQILEAFYFFDKKCIDLAPTKQKEISEEWLEKNEVSEDWLEANNKREYYWQLINIRGIRT